MNDIKEYTAIGAVNLGTIGMNFANPNSILLLLQLILTLLSIIYVGLKIFKKIKNDE
jgi:hypothetical protein